LFENIVVIEGSSAYLSVGKKGMSHPNIVYVCIYIIYTCVCIHIT
jgi:hypothetical protein